MADKKMRRVVGYTLVRPSGTAWRPSGGFYFTMNQDEAKGRAEIASKYHGPLRVARVTIAEQEPTDD